MRVALLTLVVVASLSMPQGQLPNNIRNVLGTTFDGAAAIISEAMKGTRKPPALVRPSSANQYVSALSNQTGAAVVESLKNALFDVSQMNLVFCPSEVPEQQRVMAVQLLLTSIRNDAAPAKSIGPLYGLGDAVPFETHSPSIRYPLPSVTYDGAGRWQKDDEEPEIVVWNTDVVEAVFAKAIGKSPTVAQFWITDKNAARQCALNAK